MVDNSDDYDKVDDRKSHDSGNERFIKISGNLTVVSTALLMISDKIGEDNIRAEVNIFIFNKSFKSNIRGFI
jgi:hypothetical protein